MLIKIELSNISKSFGERILFEIKNLKIYSGEKIAVSGMNGAGKSTLLNILAGLETPDSGEIKLHGEISYAAQLSTPEPGRMPSGRIASELMAAKKYEDFLSGGEKTRVKLACALEKACDILILDEPSANLDIDSIELLEKKLMEFEGTLIMVSHDRELLNNVCTRVLEIENKKINDFKCGFDEYMYQKKLIFERAQFEYETYVAEKKRLCIAANEIKQKSKKMRKAPKRMGNAEARLHTRGVNSKKAKLDRAGESLKSRIQQLEIKKKPEAAPQIIISVPETDRLHSKYAAYSNGISKTFGEKILFQNARFEIPSGSKTALTGKNGSGKTSLMKMIIAKETGIIVANQAKIGYFSQELDTLDDNMSILETVSEASARPESIVRTILARLLFRRDEVYKKIEILSGGERVKVALASLIAGDYNFLILDEPTNYLDVFSQQALEEVLSQYDITILIASHDRRFIQNIAQRELALAEYEIKLVRS